MIMLTKLNGDKFLLNCNQIEIIEMIPESKIIMLNKDYYIVAETTDQIIQKIIEYNAKVCNLHKKITVIDSSYDV